MNEIVFNYQTASLNSLLLSSVGIVISLIFISILIGINKWSEFSKLNKQYFKAITSIQILLVCYLLSAVFRSMVSYWDRYEFIDQCFKDICYSVIEGEVEFVGHSLTLLN